MSDSTLVARFGRTRGRFAIALRERLLRGEQVVVQGPRGIGKTRLREALEAEYEECHVPCALASEVGALSDVTSALVDVYGESSYDGLTQRRIRARVRNVAEQRPGVLLLDHVTNVPTALRSFLRSLRGGPIGVAYFADVDTPAQHARLRGFHLGHIELAAPEISRRALRQMLVRGHIADDDGHAQESLVRKARGRPGFILACIELARDDHYWSEGRLLVTTLAGEAELVTRRLIDPTEPLP